MSFRDANNRLETSPRQNYGGGRAHFRGRGGPWYETPTSISSDNRLAPIRGGHGHGRGHGRGGHSNHPPQDAAIIHISTSTSNLRITPSTTHFSQYDGPAKFSSSNHIRASQQNFNCNPQAKPFVSNSFNEQQQQPFPIPSAMSVAPNVTQHPQNYVNYPSRAQPARKAFHNRNRNRKYSQHGRQASWGRSQAQLGNYHYRPAPARGDHVGQAALHARFGGVYTDPATTQGQPEWVYGIGRPLRRGNFNAEEQYHMQLGSGPITDCPPLGLYYNPLQTPFGFNINAWNPRPTNRVQGYNTDTSEWIFDADCYQPQPRPQGWSRSQQRLRPRPTFNVNAATFVPASASSKSSAHHACLPSSSLLTEIQLETVTTPIGEHSGLEALLRADDTTAIRKLKHTASSPALFTVSSPECGGLDTILRAGGGSLDLEDSLVDGSTVPVRGASAMGRLELEIKGQHGPEDVLSDDGEQVTVCAGPGACHRGEDGMQAL